MLPRVFLSGGVFFHRHRSYFSRASCGKQLSLQLSYKLAKPPTPPLPQHDMVLFWTQFGDHPLNLE